MASSTPDLFDPTPEDYIFEDKEWCASNDEFSNDSKSKITLYTYLIVMVFDGLSLITHLASVLQSLLTFNLQSSSILFIWFSLVGWESIDLTASSLSVSLKPSVLLVITNTTPFYATLIFGLSSLPLCSYINKPHTFIMNLS